MKKKDLLHARQICAHILNLLLKGRCTINPSIIAALTDRIKYKAEKIIIVESDVYIVNAIKAFKTTGINDKQVITMTKTNLGTELKVSMMGDIMIARKLSIYKEPEFLEVIKLIRDSDISFVNLEGLPGNFKGYQYANFDAFPFSSASFIAEEVKWMGFNLISIANNHSLDCGPDNMFSAMEALDSAGLTYSGAGKDLEWARMPGLLDTEKGLVALVASVTGEQGVTYYQQHTRGSKPGGGFIGRPGVNGIRHDLYYVVDPKTFFDLKEIKKRFTKYFGKEEQLEVQRINRDDDKEELLLLGNRFVAGDKIGVHWLGHKLDIEANLKIVSEVYKTADWVFVSNHSHENIPYRDVGNLPADYIVDYAHDCIDAGADAFFGHGDYMGEGIEIYEDRPIFYSLAMPLYSGKSYGRIPPAGYELLGLSQDATQSEAYEASVRAFGGTDYSRWLRALLAVFKLEGEKGSRRLTELKLYPIDGGIDKPPSQFGQRPMLVKNKVLAKKIIDRYNILSAPFGTKIDFKDGIGIVKL